jgi:hypothetical protein
MFWRRKKKVTINETFLAVLIVLILMLGTLLAGSSSKAIRLRDNLNACQAQLNAVKAAMEVAE